MGGQDDGRGGGPQRLGQLVDQGDGQVVGGLVEQQDVRPGREGQREVEPPPLACRQLGHRPVRVPRAEQPQRAEPDDLARRQDAGADQARGVRRVQLAGPLAGGARRLLPEQVEADTVRPVYPAPGGGEFAGQYASSVDLPAPLGPLTASRSPDSRARLTGWCSRPATATPSARSKTTPGRVGSSGGARWRGGAGAVTRC